MQLSPKTILIKTSKLTVKIIVVFIAVVLLYLLIAYCLSRITIDKEMNTKDELSIYILTNGVHTDIVVPTRNELMDWSNFIYFDNTMAADSTCTYLALGWGDKGFYLQTPTWSDLKASVAFKAAFALSSTVIHATYYSKMTESKTCKKILINRNQYKRLINYITGTFQKDAMGKFLFISTRANYGKYDAFYEANGSYSLFKTCNTWANNALKACGQKCCLWTAFDEGIFSKYE
jgi:uncharacterized protein (TIGR02117 family)